MKLRKCLRKIKYKFIPYPIPREVKDFEFLNHDTDKNIICEHKDFSGKINVDRSYNIGLNNHFKIGTEEKIVRIEGWHVQTAFFPGKRVNLIIYTMSNGDYKNNRSYKDCKIKEYQKEISLDNFFELFKKVDFILLRRK